VTPYEVAAALRKIADKLDTLIADDDVRNLWVSIDIQPNGADLDDEYVTHVVDTIGETLFGHGGEHRVMSNGNVHHQARGNVDGVHVAAYGAVQR
jgi:hypothetical protein